MPLTESIQDQIGERLFGSVLEYLWKHKAGEAKVAFEKFVDDAADEVKCWVKNKFFPCDEAPLKETIQMTTTSPALCEAIQNCDCDRVAQHLEAEVKGSDRWRKRRDEIMAELKESGCSDEECEKECKRRLFGEAKGMGLGFLKFLPIILMLFGS